MKNVLILLFLWLCSGKLHLFTYTLFTHFYQEQLILFENIFYNGYTAILQYFCLDRTSPACCWNCYETLCRKPFLSSETQFSSIHKTYCFIEWHYFDLIILIFNKTHFRVLPLHYSLNPSREIGLLACTEIIQTMYNTLDNPLPSFWKDSVFPFCVWRRRRFSRWLLPTVRLV